MANNKQEFIREIRNLINSYAQKQPKDFYEKYSDINDKIKDLSNLIAEKNTSCLNIYKKMIETTNWAYSKTSYSFSMFTTPYDTFYVDLNKFKSNYKEEELKEFDRKADQVDNLESQTFPSLTEYFSEKIVKERNTRSKKEKAKV